MIRTTNLSDGPSGNGSTFSGVNTATLTIDNTAGADGAANYNVVVTYVANSQSETSTNVALTVSGDSKPLITAPPQAFVGCQNNLATFSVTATSTLPVTYQWFKGSSQLQNGFTVNGSVLSGVSTANLELASASVNDNASDYNVRITNSCGTVTSDNASLAIGSATLPTVTTSGVLRVSATDTYVYDGSCGLIARVNPFGVSQVSGYVTSTVTIDEAVQTYNGRPYVQRHYDIVPDNNASTATAVVSLYFTQAEFDAFNASSGVGKLLPTGSGDGTGKSNLRIVQFHGTGTAPGNYTGSEVVIDPSDANIIFDAATSSWRVIFTVNGFSGFYVMTDLVPLPVTLVDFKATPATGSTVSVTWSTTHETRNDKFIVERSKDMLVFETAGYVTDVSGEGTSVKNYRFLDQHPFYGTSYYRLKQIDTDGVTNTYPAKSVILRDQGYAVFPNPVLSGAEINLSLDEPEGAVVKLFNLEGKQIPIEKQDINGVNVAIRPSTVLIPGVYIIKVEERGTVRQHRVVVL